MKHLKVLTLSVAALGLAAGLAGTANAAEKWDMPLAYAASNFHSENAAEFATCVGAGTKGELTIVTHPSGSLFKGNEIKRAVQTGQAPIGERLLSAHANENAIFGIDSIPFLATSFEAAEKLNKAAAPTVAKILDEQNLVLLYSVPWPPQGLYFKKDVNSVADMKGIKFRSYNTATARMAELAGMLPVQVEAAELSQALATGVAEAFISSGATGYDRKVWEQLTHFYEVDAWLPRNTVFANKDAWNGLDDAARAAVQACANTAAEAGLKRAIAYTDFTLNGLREGGMKVQKAGDQLRDDLNKIGEVMSEEWFKEAGPEGKAIVDKFKAM
jgi:TRAP-type C4-dicarboxylate transport system substrate-binding protein